MRDEKFVNKEIIEEAWKTRNANPGRSVSTLTAY
jgi:hypothetical protein